MTYVDFQRLDETRLPRANGADLQMAMRQIRERFSYFPQVRYYTIAVKTAPPVAPGYLASERSIEGTVVPAAAGGPNPDPSVIDIYPEFSGNFTKVMPPVTQMDPLWREAVARDDQVTGWKQPHGDDDLPAERNQIEEHTGPHWFHARFQKQEKERNLKRYGFDKVRAGILTVPTVTLDALGISVNPGDWFELDGRKYEVLESTTTGDWVNTNVKLYVVANCEIRRAGS